MLKTCVLCKQEKELTEFNKNKCKKDNLNTLCRECSKKHSKKYYKENFEKHKGVTKERRDRNRDINRNKLISYLLIHPCIDCGETDPIVLQFDHQKDKSFNISQKVCNGYSWKIITDEIKKCEVRCANCHLKKTAKQFNWYKYQIQC